MCAFVCVPTELNDCFVYLITRSFILRDYLFEEQERGSVGKRTREPNALRGHGNASLCIILNILFVVLTVNIIISIDNNHQNECKYTQEMRHSRKNHLEDFSDPKQTIRPTAAITTVIDRPDTVEYMAIKWLREP